MDYNSLEMVTKITLRLPLIILDLLQKSFSSIDGTGKIPIPQELFFLVGWASCPS
jgi:hypothetical protein